MTAVPRRSEVPQEHQWNAESVFPDTAAWKAELDALHQAIPQAAAYSGRLSESPALLAEALEAMESVERRVGTVYFYAAMTSACDSTDDNANGMVGQAGALFASMAGAFAFTEPELLTIGHETLKAWMQQEPRLAVYAQRFDDLFRRQRHVRSAEVEEVLGLSADAIQTLADTAELITNADMQFADAIDSEGNHHPVTQGTMDKHMNQPDLKRRETAWNSFFDAHLALKNGLANNLAGAIKRDVFFARARRHSSSLEAALFANNIPVEVFHNLIDTFRRHIPTWHKYWRVRRKALGLETLHPYDVWAPIATRQPTITFSDAVRMIAEGMQPLGDEYVGVLRRGCLEERWVDIYPNVGKRQGAFSYGQPGTHPFIMMNFNDTLNSMSTLAHELGHSMHSYYTWQNQPYAYSGYSLFVAEVASNFNQALVRAHLLKTQEDPQFRIAVIEEAMYNFHRYFFQMPTLARFELAMHERAERGESLTADIMISTMADLFAEGYGDEVQFDRQRVGATWATFGHLYANFYVFQYATGISAAHALAERVLTQGEPAAEAYLGFLKAGSSRYALDILQSAGVDMRTPEAVEKTFAVLEHYVDQLEALTN